MDSIAAVPKKLQVMDLEEDDGEDGFIVVNNTELNKLEFVPDHKRTLTCFMNGDTFNPGKY